METLIPAIAAFFVVALFLLMFARGGNQRNKDVLKRVAGGKKKKDAGSDYFSSEDTTLVPENDMERWFYSIPGVQSTWDLLLKAGYKNKLPKFFLVSYGLFLGLVLLSFFVLKQTSPLVLFFVPFILTIFLSRKHLKRCIHKRNELFTLQFPDAVDMIVRSVRSGHPLNTALRMISDNMDSPVKDEFRQVVDEVAYGRTLTDSLQRMAKRIGQQDLHFFVVVLSVQQETGGSLAEVLTNLSSIIRKRRQLVLKIRALTSEGRATSYILGSIPFVEIGALYYITPAYVEILFNSGTLGYMILGTAITLIVSAIIIVRKMVNIDI